MADTRADWTVLRGTIVLTTVCALASAAMLVGSYYFRQSMEQEYDANHGRFRVASRQYLAVDEEERIIHEYYPVFVRMHRQGLLGEERRLSWLETLREAGGAIRIPELSYKVDAQKPIEPEFRVALGDFSLYASPMNLSMGLLHEGDLFRLLRALDREALGQYTVRSCEFRVREGEFVLDPTRANVRAECVLEWMTVDLSGDRELEL